MDPPAQQSEKIYSQHTSNGFTDNRSYVSTSSKRGKKKGRRKNKHKHSHPGNDAPVVEDISTKLSDESSIPDLQDATHRENSTVSTIGMSESSTRYIPSVVSLEEE